MPPQDIDATARFHSSYNLEIQNVRISDAGEYACQIGSIVPKEIVHSLEILGKFFIRLFVIELLIHLLSIHIYSEFECIRVLNHRIFNYC